MTFNTKQTITIWLTEQKENGFLIKLYCYFIEGNFVIYWRYFMIVKYMNNDGEQNII